MCKFSCYIFPLGISAFNWCYVLFSKNTLSDQHFWEIQCSIQVNFLSNWVAVYLRLKFYIIRFVYVWSQNRLWVKLDFRESFTCIIDISCLLPEFGSPVQWLSNVLVRIILMYNFNMVFCCLGFLFFPLYWDNWHIILTFYLHFSSFPGAF